MIKGFDVSHWQEVTDWQKVAGTGYRFVFLKATDGMNYKDPSFKGNLAGATGARLKIGAYHFFRPLDPVSVQAANFLSLAKGLKLPALDLEWTKTALHQTEDWEQVSLDSRLERVLGWLKQVESALGVKPVVYTSHAFISQYFPAADFFKDYPLWVARYADSPGELPAPWGDWTFWQSSPSGQVEGIAGKVDLDVFNGDESALSVLAG